MMKVFKGLIACSFLELKVLVLSFLLLPLVRFSLSLFGYRKSMSMLKYLFQLNLETDFYSQESRIKQSEIVARMIGISANYLPFLIKCLPKSMVLHCILHRLGIAGTVCFGVNDGGNEFEAHSWVEVDGRPIHQGTDFARKYLPFHKQIIPRT